MKPTLTLVGKSVPAEYFTPEVKALCARVSHKMELTDKELLMLALVAAQAALAHYFHPGERSAEDALNTIGRILDHSDVVEALQRQIKLEDEKPEAPPAIAGP